MSFSLLYPLALLGALALAAPVWLHLRRKPETNIHRFSALRFLDDAPQPRRSPLRLQNVWLLLCRLLALLLLILAFAWPYRREAAPPPIRESRVYLLDNSLSHQVGNGFERDRDRIRDALAQTSSDVQIAVVELTAEPKVIAGFADDRETARQRVAALRPSFQRGAYIAGFRQANTLLANSLGSRKRIVFYGDSQENQWTEGLNSPPFLQGVDIETATPGERLQPNAALAEPRAQRIFLGEKSLVNFTVKLLHSSNVQARCTVSLRANGQLIFSRPIDLTDEPPVLTLQAQWEAEPKEWLRMETLLEAAPDALAGDNRVYCSLPPVREGTVALLARSPYLRLALSPEVMRGQWAARFLDPARLAQTVEATDQPEVVCLESAYLQSPDARKLVHQQLTNGRGVILLVHRVTPPVHGALRELGFTVQSISEPETKWERFQYVFNGHPVFHPFLSPDYGNLLEIQARPQARLKASTGMPLVFGSSGEALFFHATQFPGRLLVAGFGLEPDQTSWPTHVSFIPFLDLALQFCRPEDPTRATYEPGEMSLVSLPVDAPVRELVLRAADREFARVPVVQGKARLPMPDEPGLYTVTGDSSKETLKIFSVNPSPKESQLTYLANPEALALWRLEAATANAATAPAPVPAAISPASVWRQQWWWWVLLGAAAALILETLWASMRKEAT